MTSAYEGTVARTTSARLAATIGRTRSSVTHRRFIARDSGGYLTVTVIGLQVGFLIGGAIVVETVFAVPGIGSFGIDAITKRDYPQVQAFVLVGALAFVLANLIVDLLYSWLDPRIRYA